jgi:hypothetical protein
VTSHKREGFYAVAAVAVTLFAGLTAPSARADELDTLYIGCIKRYGLVFNDPNDAVRLRHQIDHALKSGVPPATVSSQLMNQDGMSQFQAQGAVACELLHISSNS